MYGIRLRGKQRRNKYEEGTGVFCLDFDFSDIVDAVPKQFEQLYWVFQSVYFDFPMDDEAEESRLQAKLTETTDQLLRDGESWRYAGPSFVNDFAAYISGFDSQICGCANKEQVMQIEFNDIESIKMHAELYLFDVDAAFWEVHSKRSAVVEVLRKIFRYTELASIEV